MKKSSAIDTFTCNYVENKLCNDIAPKNITEARSVSFEPLAKRKKKVSK